MDDIRTKVPTHPGGFIKAEVIEPLGFSVTAAADVLGVMRAALSALHGGWADLSSEMETRSERASGVSIETLMQMQNSFDIAEARHRGGDIKVTPFRRKPRDPRQPLP